MKQDLIQVDGKFYIRSKVVMLPTEEVSQIGTDIRSDSFPRLLHYSGDNWQHTISTRDGYRKNYHLYFLSDEEIKEGDSFIYDNKIYNEFKPTLTPKVTINIRLYPNNDLSEQFVEVYLIDCKKVISSTDKSLGLQRPSDAFLQVYCLNGGIDEVVVEYDVIKDDDNGKPEFGGYDVPDKYVLKVAPDNTITIKPFKEKVYTRDEVIKIAHDAWLKGALQHQNPKREQSYTNFIKTI
jgi:hypothetical protein